MTSDTDTVRPAEAEPEASADSAAEREIRSEHCATLTLLRGPAAFARHLQQILANGRRFVDILSTQLDPPLFADPDVCAQLSRLAREHRQAEIRVLVREPSALLGKRHALVALQSRLTSKIKIRHLKIAPEDKAQGYVIVDQRQLLLQHRDGEFDGFCNTDTAPNAQALLEEFNQLWQRQAEEIPELRTLPL